MFAMFDFYKLSQTVWKLIFEQLKKPFIFFDLIKTIFMKIYGMGFFIFFILLFETLSKIF